MKKEIISQYFSSLDMLDECIRKYDEDLWLSRDYQNPAWQVCYHALFYTNIYLSPSAEAIRKWEGEIEDYHDLKKVSPSEGALYSKEYSREEMEGFLAQLRENVEHHVEAMDPEEDCWPFWYEENQLEFHMNNLRHLQHHTGELFERMNNRSAVTYKWR